MSENIKSSRSEIYDNWAKLVEAVLDREELRELALCPSISSSISGDTSARYSSPEINRNPSLPRRIPLKDIKKATRNFDRELRLGGGAFSFFYKGQILRRSLGDVKGFIGSFPTTVLIEKLDPDSKERFLTEIKYLSQLDHPNVIKLKGYCIEGNNMVLVYEYLSKGALGDHLFREKPRSLPWSTRIKVAVDIARALAYLHDSKIQVIHGDIRLGRILLDEGFNAKISGFGFARDGPENDLPLLSDVIWGTRGIVGPEYITSGHLSTQYDVYTFGVILLQIISGRRDPNDILEEGDFLELAKEYTEDELWFNLLELAKACTVNELWLAKLIDHKLEDRFPLDQAHIVLTLAKDCLNSDPELRPQMCEVLATLEALFEQSGQI